jgi:tellurite resistance protein
MIIWGTRGVTSTSGQGRFHCPSCEGERAYKAKRLRRFFTLYFIPLIPLDIVHEWIECGQCGGTFKPEVLKYDPRARQQAARAAIVVAARRVLAIAAGASPSAARRAAAAEAHRTLFGEEWAEAELGQDLARAASAGSLEPVSSVAGEVNVAGKEAILSQAVEVARADGEVAPETARALAEAAAALGLTEAHWRGILGQAAPAA